MRGKYTNLSVKSADPNAWIGIVNNVDNVTTFELQFRSIFADLSQAKHGQP
jgi:hypothetical protein